MCRFLAKNRHGHLWKKCAKARKLVLVFLRPDSVDQVGQKPLEKAFPMLPLVCLHSESTIKSYLAQIVGSASGHGIATKKKKFLTHLLPIICKVSKPW